MQKYVNRPEGYRLHVSITSMVASPCAKQRTRTWHRSSNMFFLCISLVDFDAFSKCTVRDFIHWYSYSIVPLLRSRWNGILVSFEVFSPSVFPNNRRLGFNFVVSLLFPSSNKGRLLTIEMLVKKLYIVKGRKAAQLLSSFSSNIHIHSSMGAKTSVYGIEYGKRMNIDDTRIG